MENNAGGFNSDDRQRETAAEIARRKVLKSYSSSPVFNAQIQAQQSQQNQQNQQPQSPGQQTGTYKKAQINVQGQDLQRYHSAWQNYYQKYYSDYYSKAAKNYIETERLKDQRTKNDRARMSADKLDPDETDNEVIADTLRETIQKKANSRFKLPKKHRKFIPIFAGVFVVLLILFLQYNRLIFAPIMAYVAPGNSDGNDISTIDPTVSVAASDENKLIIPKLNVDVPVHFGISNDTATVNQAMMNGVAHFMVPGASAYPGQVGNTVITGHSAGDIYSSNQYKFIFSGLERLTEGDLIYIDYNKVRYTYKMTGSKTVDPDDVESLVYDGNKAILTLITCWPLGTSQYRLEVIAEQINPAIETESETPTEDPEVKDSESEELPKNEKSFFEKVWDFLTGNS